MSAADEIAQGLADVPPIDATIIGTFVSQDGALAVVDVGAARVTMPNIGSSVPYPGQSVRVLRIGKQTFLWGPAVPGWPIGKVVSFAAPVATVEYPPGSGTTRDLGCPSGMSLAPGDFVLIDWTSGGLVSAGPYALAALPAVTTPADPSGGTGGGQHRQVFTALDSGSFNAHWWTNNVWDSNNNDGAAFYGGKIHATVGPAAVINAISVYLPLSSSSGFAPVLRGHTSGSKPGGTVAFTGPSYSLPTRSGWVAIPTTFGDLLKANDFGLGFAHGTGGYNIFSGTQADGLSFAVDITWTTS